MPDEKLSAENENTTAEKDAVLSEPKIDAVENPDARGAEISESDKTESERSKPKKRGAIRGTVKTLVKYVRPQAALIIMAVIAAVMSAGLELAGPIFASFAVDVISDGIASGGVDMSEFVKYAVIEIGVYGGTAALMWLQGFIMTSVTQAVTKRMRRDIACKINKLPLEFFDTSSHGDTLSRVTNDADTVGQSLNQAVITLVLSCVMLLGSVIIMFVINAVLAASAIAATLVGFVVMTLIMKKSHRFYVGQQKSLGEVDGHIEETFSGQLTVKAYGAEAQSKSKFKSINDRLYDSAWKAQFFGSVMGPLMAFVGNLGYVTVMVVGAALVVNGSITIGVITAFTLYVNLFSQPLSQLAQVMTQLQPATAAAERIFEFLREAELPAEKDGARPIANVKGDVTFNDVRFGYSQDKAVIHGFSAAVKAGQKVAIVGPTGTGKTTLVNLLMRFYELDGGNIYIDGTPICDITREAVHGMFGMVLQDTWLFEGTVRENIAFGRPGASDADVENACEKAGLSHWLATLKDGLDTVIDEEMSVSAGQRQLLTIARAMVENAPMLILDEATSSVDTRTELIIQNAMDELSKGRTSFVIAHRLSTVKNADLIIVMKNGDIVESGTHAELLDKHGFYHELYSAQFAV